MFKNFSRTHPILARVILFLFILDGCLVYLSTCDFDLPAAVGFPRKRFDKLFSNEFDYVQKLRIGDSGYVMLPGGTIRVQTTYPLFGNLEIRKTDERGRPFSTISFSPDGTQTEVTAPDRFRFAVVNNATTDIEVEVAGSKHLIKAGGEKRTFTDMFESGKDTYKATIYDTHGTELREIVYKKSMGGTSFTYHYPYALESP